MAGNHNANLFAPSPKEPVLLNGGSMSRHEDALRLIAWRLAEGLPKNLRTPATLVAVPASEDTDLQKLGEYVGTASDTRMFNHLKEIL